MCYTDTRMKTVLFFHTSQRQAWQKELAGAYRFARLRKWRVQVIEPTKRPPAIPKLIDFWHPLGCVAECSGAPSDYFDPAAFGSLPVVYLGRDPRSLPPSASFVNPSCRGGPGQCAAIELLTAGYRSFGFVAASGDPFWSRDREAEFRKTLWANGYSCSVFGREGNFRDAKARSEALLDWVKGLPKPCGIMAANDYYAGEALDIARQLRQSVPLRVAVIGADNDSSLCENAKPTLSSVFLDYEQAGYHAFEILSTLIDRPDAGPVRETYRTLGLIRRGSTPAGIGTPPRVAKALAYIRQKACEGISSADVAARMPGSRRLAEMEFRRVTGRSILEEILNVRFERVEFLLRDKSQQLNAVAAQCGWKTENALRTAFLKRYGKSMRVWRKDSLAPATA